MPNANYSRGSSRSSGRPSSQSSSKKRFGSSSRGRGRQGQYIDVSRYVKKAVASIDAKPYVAKHVFADFDIDARILKNIEVKGYVSPTAIQDQSIPHILNGKDLVGVANTGTGKTAAFLLPLLNKIIKDRTQRILVIVPTRELALQVEEEFYSFAKGLKIDSAICIGGAFIGRQIQDLRNAPHFVVGTPGRLKDLVDRKALPLKHFNNIVLDEVDRMLDMGFVLEIKELLNQLPEVRQSCFFSATLPPAIQQLINSFLDKPITVSVRTGETSDNIEQNIIRVISRNKKIEQLHELLLKPEFEKVLVFIKTKLKAEEIKSMLLNKGVSVDSIHGDKPQSKRQSALLQFKQNKVKVLVATDVASRGLDISGVTHVINYDTPESYDDYIHRIGRTGRGNQKGTALTFID